MQLITCILVVVVCVTMTTAAPRHGMGPGPGSHGPGPHGPGPHGPKLPHLACEIRNMTDNSVLKNVTCGCEDETPVDCTWGPLQVGDLQMTFCDLSDSTATLPGVLSAGCNVTNTTDTDGKCRDEETCTEGPLEVTVDGTQYSALFCTHTQRAPRPEDNNSDDSDDDKPRKDCVPLEKPLGGSGNSGGGQSGGRPSGGRPRGGGQSGGRSSGGGQSGGRPSGGGQSGGRPSGGGQSGGRPSGGGQSGGRPSGGGQSDGRPSGGGQSDGRPSGGGQRGGGGRKQRRGS